MELDGILTRYQQPLQKSTMNNPPCSKDIPKFNNYRDTLVFIKKINNQMSFDQEQ
jgi:hypothetical protein